MSTPTNWRRDLTVNINQLNTREMDLSAVLVDNDMAWTEDKCRGFISSGYFLVNGKSVDPAYRLTEKDINAWGVIIVKNVNGAELTINVQRDTNGLRKDDN